MEKTAYIILAISAAVWVAIWLIALLVGVIALTPIGLLWLLPLVGFGLLFFKALQDRLNNPEDDYYSKHIDE